MPSTTVKREWSKLTKFQSKCATCSTECTTSLLADDARPIFGRFRPWRKGVLFVFEAPNGPDTYDAEKGYLTYDEETDPTGRFARTLMVEELGLSPQYFQVTNSVLCLPRRKNDKFPVTSQQTKLCAEVVGEQIRVLDPVVVVPVGGQALKALRHVAPHSLRSLGDAVAKPVKWSERWLFPVYHTSMLARNGPSGRREAEQRKDWRKLRKFLKREGVDIPKGIKVCRTMQLGREMAADVHGEVRYCSFQLASCCSYSLTRASHAQS
jgi:uracil-DNA glycosylase family 4